MRRFFSQMNPTLRGFLIIAVIVVLIIVLQLQATLVSLGLIARVALFIAMAFFVYLVWRENRAEIHAWPRRAVSVFYGAAFLIVTDLVVVTVWGAPGVQVLAFVAVIVLCAVAMWRVWKDQHTYGI
jgi:small-conductance mechanosensitive channel